MKKIILFVAVVVMAFSALAQTPKISYQAVVRDANNRLVTNTPVTVDVEITYGSNTYTETGINTTTNANGLMSLMIGNASGYDNIVWKNATIKTTVSFNNSVIESTTNVMAVPYALNAKYVEDVNPNASTIQAIYNKLQADSLSLANGTKNLTDKVRADSLALGALIDANSTDINNLQNADASLGQRITADSTNLANFKNKVRADSLALGTLIDKNKVAIVDSSAHIRAEMSSNVDNLQSQITNNDNDITNLQNSDVTISNRITADSAALHNALKDTASAIRATVNTKANAADVYTKYETYTKAEVDNLIEELRNLINNSPKMMQEHFVIHEDQSTTETVFTLSKAIKTDFIYRMYVNGVMVGGNHNGVLSPVDFEEKEVKYDGTHNGNYKLKEGDVVTIVYWYIQTSTSSESSTIIIEF